jgi:hypothetical protein
MALGETKCFSGVERCNLQLRNGAVVLLAAANCRLGAKDHANMIDVPSMLATLTAS